MMGSSGSSESGLIEALLLVVSKPELLKKNLEALQEGVAKHDAARSDANDACRVAALRLEETTQMAESLRPKLQELAVMKNQVEERHLQVQEEETILRTERQKLFDSQKAHEEALKSLAQREDALERNKANLKASIDGDNRAIDKREDAVAAREAAVAGLEAAAEAVRAEFQKKLDDIKKLAHA